MSRKKQLARFMLSLFASTAIPDLALPQQPSGTAVRVSPDASATGVTGTRVLQAPGDVYQGDQIATDPNGQAQIQFVDDTRFIVGPNSRVVIDEFVFNPNRTAQDVTLDAVRGTFRFISGNSPSEAYTVRTPTMTIGVRGSAFNLAVLASRETLLQWLEDSGIVCVVPEGASERIPSQCVEATAGTLLSAPPGGGFREFQPGERLHLTTQLFSGLNTAGNLAPGFGVQLPPGGRGSPETFGQGENDDADEVEDRQPPIPPPVVTEAPSVYR